MADEIKVGATVKVQLFGKGRVVTENGEVVDLTFVSTEKEPRYSWEPEGLTTRTMYVVEYRRADGSIGRGTYYRNEIEETGP